MYCFSQFRVIDLPNKRPNNLMTYGREPYNDAGLGVDRWLFFSLPSQFHICLHIFHSEIKARSSDDRWPEAQNRKPNTASLKCLINLAHSIHSSSKWWKKWNWKWSHQVILRLKPLDCLSPWNFQARTLREGSLSLYRDLSTWDRTQSHIAIGFFINLSTILINCTLSQMFPP